MNTVENIITEIESITAAYLGGDWQKMPFVFEVEKNDHRRGERSYGVRPLDASTNETILKSTTLDHSFELILMNTVPRGNNDDSQRMDVVKDLFDKADDIFVQMVNTKINLPNIVLNLQERSLSEPEFTDGAKFVLQRMQFIVRYRSIL